MIRHPPRSPLFPDTPLFQSRLKVLPISLALPWGVNVGDMLGHLPLPSKIVVETLPPIHLREEFGDKPDIDEVYDQDRKSTRLNSSHANISYAVFCLK